MMNDGSTPKGALPEATANLASLLQRLPGIGGRTATLAAIQMSRRDAHHWDDLAASIRSANSAASKCIQCHGIADRELCAICRDPSRRHDQICVVERPDDVHNVEGTGYYSGLYHVLHGALEPLRGIGPDQLTLSHLIERADLMREDPMAEIILATSNTLEGNATADYIVRALAGRDRPVQITALRKGIADRAPVEFADPLTIANAMSNRSPDDAEFPADTP